MYSWKPLTLACSVFFLFVATVTASASDHVAIGDGRLRERNSFLLGNLARNVNWSTQDELIHKPEVAADRLYDAWKKRDRSAALRVASRETVDKLFAHPFILMNLQGCSERERGSAQGTDELPLFKCIYASSRSAETLDIVVAGGASVGFSVVSVDLQGRDSKQSSRPDESGKAATAAEVLYDAWEKNDRPAALKVASQETVDKLFGHHWIPRTFQGCRQWARDSVLESIKLPSYKCAYVGPPKNGTTVDILVTGTSSAGFGVSSILVRKSDSAGSGPVVKATNATAAAGRLYEAWRTHDLSAASQVAYRVAVDKLFTATWHPMKFMGCQNVDRAFQCIYRDAKSDYSVSFDVKGDDSSRYWVTHVSFSTEE